MELDLESGVTIREFLSHRPCESSAREGAVLSALLQIRG